MLGLPELLARRTEVRRQHEDVHGIERRPVHVLLEKKRSRTFRAGDVLPLRRADITRHGRHWQRQRACLHGVRRQGLCRNTRALQGTSGWPGRHARDVEAGDGKVESGRHESDPAIERRMMLMIHGSYQGRWSCSECRHGLVIDGRVLCSIGEYRTSKEGLNCTRFVNLAPSPFLDLSHCQHCGRLCKCSLFPSLDSNSSVQLCDTCASSYFDRAHVEMERKKRVLMAATSVKRARGRITCSLCNGVADCTIFELLHSRSIPVCDACLGEMYPVDANTVSNSIPVDARDVVKMATEQLREKVAKSIPRARICR